MVQIFRPSADTVVRVVLISILVVPFLAIAIAYWVMQSSYITNQNITLGRTLP
jgi:hypothetical protein